MAEQTAALSRWSGEFVSPSTEAQYLETRWPGTARQLRVVTAISILAYFSPLYFNWSTFDEMSSLYTMGVMRTMVITLLGLVFYSTFNPRFSNTTRFLLLAAELSLGVSETVEYHLYLQQLDSPRYQDPVIISFAILIFYTVFPNRALLTLIACTVCGLSIPLYLLLWSDASAPQIFLHLIYGFAANALGVVILMNWNRITRLDYTRQKQLDEEIGERKRAEAEALEVSRAKSIFLAQMNHELRTPLSVVLGGVELLRETPLSSGQRGQLDTINRSGKLLASLIEDVLDLARIEAGQIELTHADFELAELLADVETILRHQANGRGIGLEMVLDENTPPFLIGDATRLRQILINLGGNAVKFTEHGRITIEVNMLAQNGDAVRLRFRVKDTGIGLTPDEQTEIFAPFAQADDSIHRRYGGSGLGLTICRELVTAMGGAIHLESEKGLGSSFSFEIDLPVGDGARLPKEQIDATAAPAFLLLVEDTEAIRIIIATLLERMGHHVTQAENGSEAVRLAACGEFDAVLTDLHMPDMDGFETTRRIRSLNKANAATLPIIALSADVRQNVIDECLDSGMQAFVAKPVDRDRLDQVLSKVLTGLHASFATETDRVDRTDEVIDRDYLEEIHSDLGSERFNQAIETCINSLHELAAAIDSSVNENGWDRLKTAAHRLKGVSGSYGLMVLHQHARQLENAAVEQAHESIYLAAAPIKAMTDSAVAGLQRILAEKRNQRKSD